LHTRPLIPLSDATKTNSSMDPLGSLLTARFPTSVLELLAAFAVGSLCLSTALLALAPARSEDTCTQKDLDELNDRYCGAPGSRLPGPKMPHEASHVAANLLAALFCVTTFMFVVARALVTAWVLLAEGLPKSTYLALCLVPLLFVAAYHAANSEQGAGYAKLVNGFSGSALTRLKSSGDLFSYGVTKVVDETTSLWRPIEFMLAPFAPGREPMMGGKKSRSSQDLASLAGKKLFGGDAKRSVRVRTAL